MNRSRAVFLPSPGDPYVLLHCLKYFHEVWQDEVDKIYIDINSNIGDGVIDALLKILDHPKMDVSFINHQTGHGQSLNRMLDRCTEDYIMFLEDDFFIFKPGIVNYMFKIIEQGGHDVVGSPRTSCTPNATKIAYKKFNLKFVGACDQGPALWPCLLFAKRQDLLRTDRVFGNYGLKAGEQLLGVTLTEQFAGDTFVWASLQLYDMGLKIFHVPQNHCNPNDFHNRKHRITLFDGKCKYMHSGSLSSGIHRYLIGPDGKVLQERKASDPLINLSQEALNQTPMEKAELERRVMWWRKALREFKEPLGLKEFGELYEYAIENVIQQFNITLERLDEWENLYMGVING